MDTPYRDLLNEFLNDIATQSVNGGSEPDCRRCPTCESLDHRECDLEVLKAENDEVREAVDGEKYDPFSRLMEDGESLEMMQERLKGGTK